MCSTKMPRLFLALLLFISFSFSVSFAGHENNSNQTLPENDTLPDFDELETLPDLDELDPIESTPPPIENNIPEPPPRENTQPSNTPIPVQPDISSTSKGETQEELVLIIKGEVVKIANGKLLINMRSGYIPNIGDKVEFNNLYPKNAVSPAGSGVIIESDKEVWALISKGTPNLGMDAVITSKNPRKVANFQPEQPPVANVPTEPDINASPEELYRAGGMFFRGVDGPQDYEKAFKWIKLAAEKGHTQAQNDVGVMYETGKGVNLDPQQAMYWFKKSAEGNYPLGHYNLGRAYDTGMAGRKNFSEALKSFRRAAKLGEPKAQKRLRKQRLRW